MPELILYGRGLIAEEYCRYLEGQGRGGDIAAFAVTKLEGRGEEYCGRPCLEIRAAIKTYPEADVHLALQEKYHQEVMDFLKDLGKTPKEIIGLHRMTELLGEQGISEISAACPELTVRRNPHDYSMLEIRDKEHPERRCTFYPMTQVPLREEEMANLRQTVKSLHMEGEGEGEGGDEVLYIAMATSAKDAKVPRDTLPPYVHPVLGGAANYTGTRQPDMDYDDETVNKPPPQAGTRKRGSQVGSPAGDRRRRWKGEDLPKNAIRNHLSPHNHLYSELTVAHWLWQKAPKAKYLGLCHYRRHFVLTEEIRQAMAEGTVDVLLTTPRLTFPNVHQYFATLPVTTMDEEDFRLMLRLIEQEDSEIAKFSKDFLEGQIHFPNNMVIAKRDIYLDYCRFMFGVLQGMQEKYRIEGMARPDRYLGYVGELLTTVYFAYHRGKWRTEYIDYRLLQEI